MKNIIAIWFLLIVSFTTLAADLSPHQYVKSCCEVKNEEKGECLDFENIYPDIHKQLCFNAKKMKFLTICKQLNLDAKKMEISNLKKEIARKKVALNEKLAARAERQALMMEGLYR